MTKERAVAVAAVVCAMAVLPGCYVTSVNLPDAPQFFDERLVGAWLSVETDTLQCCGYFQRLKERSALRLVTIDDESIQVFEFTTLLVGDKQLFAATLVLDDWSSSEKNGQSRQYHLGHYVVNDDELVLYLLDAKKIKELVSRSILEGTVDSDGAVTLTGSPADLTRFLTSPEAESPGSAAALRLRRFRSDVATAIERPLGDMPTWGAVGASPGSGSGANERSSFGGGSRNSVGRVGRWPACPRPSPTTARQQAPALPLRSPAPTARLASVAAWESAEDR